MLFLPAFFFTLLLGIGVAALVGCVALGILCYRLLAERRRLLLRLEHLEARHAALPAAGEAGQQRPGSQAPDPPRS